MAERYRHTQRGTVMVVMLLIGAVVAAVTTLPAPGGVRWAGLPITLVLAGMAWLFSSLTVIVCDDDVEWYFGPGAWKYRMPRAEIANVSIVRNSAFSGFGIRMRPGFRLYNVSGLDAVELQLRDGKVRRIGTDDARGLASVLRGE